jgi:methyltransferase (TIGR00027 family)
VINDDEPSQTALTAAAARAAHLIVDNEPLIFADTLAADLLGDRAEEFIAYHRVHGTHIVLSTARAQVICRSRYTEDRLARAVRRGVTQYVILGAGLDSFAYRAGPACRVRVFEVDHPATQQWKRTQLSNAQIPEPGGVAFVATDFEAGALSRRLIESGFDSSAPALVSWLGVTMYLTRDAISATVADLSSFAAGTELITDYMLPAHLRDAAGRTYAELVAPAAAEHGEPWLSMLAPDEMSALLAEYGFEAAEHVSQHDQVDPALWNRSDSLRPISSSLIARATLTASG